MFLPLGLEVGCKLIWWWRLTCIIWRIQWTLQQWGEYYFKTFGPFSFLLLLLYYSPSPDAVCFIQVYVLKPSHKSTLQSKISENPIPDSVSAVHNATNGTRDVESEFEAGHEGKIKELLVDNADSTVCIIAKACPFHFDQHRLTCVTNVIGPV